MTGFTIRHDDELERDYGKWVLVRRSLGVTSFGINEVELPPGEAIPEHDETGRDHEELYQLAEALIEWDERVTMWRIRHYKVVARVIGDEVVGTQGTPVELLGGLIKNKLYPELWQARNELTALANEDD